MIKNSLMRVHPLLVEIFLALNDPLDINEFYVKEKHLRSEKCACCDLSAR